CGWTTARTPARSICRTTGRWTAGRCRTGRRSTTRTSTSAPSSSPASAWPRNDRSPGRVRDDQERHHDDSDQLPPGLAVPPPPPTSRRAWPFRLTALGVTLLAGVAVLQAQQPLTAVSREVNKKLVKLYGAGGFKGLPSYGTGVLVSPNGYVLTVNNHILTTQ